MNRGKQTALIFTILMIVFVLYGEYQRRSAEPTGPVPQATSR